MENIENLQNYKIISLEDKKEVILCDSNEKVFIDNSENDLLEKIKTINSNELCFSCGNNSYKISDFIRVLISMKHVGDFCFYFKNDIGNIDELKNKVKKLASLDVSTEELKTKKIFEMLDIVLQYRPILAYCDFFNKYLNEYKYPDSFFLIAKAYNSKEIDTRKKEALYFDFLTFLFSPCIMLVTFFEILNMINNGVPYFVILIFCEVINIGSFIFCVSERNKETNNYLTFSKEKKYWYIYNLLGIVIGLFIIILFIFFKKNFYEKKQISLFILFSLIFSLILIVAIYFLCFAFHSSITKKKSKKDMEERDIIKKDNSNSKMETFSKEDTSDSNQNEKLSR